MLFTLWLLGATSAPAPPAAYLGWNLGTFTPGDAYQVPEDAAVVEEQDFAAKQAPEMMSFNRYIKEVSSLQILVNTKEWIICISISFEILPQ